MIFDRTAAGDVKPKRVIKGPKARVGNPGNMRINPETGLIFVVQQAGYIGVWHLDDNGEVPPRFTVGGPKGLLEKPRGLDLDPEAQRGHRVGQGAQRGPDVRGAAAVPRQHTVGRRRPLTAAGVLRERR